MDFAMASNITVTFSNEGKPWKLYEDDGIGMQQEYLNQTGIGLWNIESRLFVLSGTMS